MKNKTVQALLAAATLLALAACGGKAGGSSSTSNSSAGGKAGPADSLAIGLDVTIQTLNPAMTPQTTNVAYSYDPLIYKAADGTYVPDLATEWKYVGTDNKKFELTLRKGVKFQDGTDVTATAVKNSIEYFLKTPNPNAGNVGQIASVVAVGDDVVDINYSAAFPNAIDIFTQYWGIGLIIGPKGLADPKGLEKTTDGAGQYTLDSTKTVTDSVYTFDANPNYFNQSAIQYKTIELKPLPDANARLSALKSGQIQDATQIQLGQIGLSAADGYQQVKGNTTWVVLKFLKTSSGMLAKSDVRQALNYGVDRDSIVKDFYKNLAVSQDQFAPQGLQGYTSALDGKYTYDATKAKQLLSSGGATSGTTLKVLTNSIADPGGLLGQVLKSQYASIGITVDLNVISGTFAQFGAALASGQYDAVLWNVFSTDMYTAATQTLVGEKALLNPGGTVDAQVKALLDTAAAATTTPTFTKAQEDLNNYLTTNAIGVPIATRTNVDVIAPNIIAPTLTYTTPQSIPVGPDAKYAWKTKA